MASNESETPLVGKVFCCTAVDPDLRNEIIKCVEAMGGIHRVNLMSDVKYMVVGSRDTPKYDFAVKDRIDMTFIRPTFIPELFKKWQAAEDMDSIENELEQGKLDVFEGMKVCCTNISDGRDELRQLIEKHGGSFSPDLTRNVTHLVSGGTEGRKYHFAKKWDIFTVHPDWVNDSIRRGAALREEFYSLDLPSDEIGKGACAQWPDEYKKLQEEEAETINAAPRRLKKRKIDFGNVWDSVLFENNRDRRKLATTASAAGDAADQSSGAWKDRELPEPAVETADEQQQVRKKPELMFQDQIFRFVGYEDSKLPVLHNAVKSHGGRVNNDDSDVNEPTLFIVNSTLEPSKRPELDVNAVAATEWMIERSMHKKQIVMDRWGVLMKYYDIPGLNKLNIHFTGFSGIEALHLPKLIKLLGGSRQQMMEAKPGLPNSTDLVVVNSENPKYGVKVKLCLRHKIPMVNEKWLFECADRGVIVHLDSPDFVMFGKPEVGKIIRRRSVERDEEDSRDDHDSNGNDVQSSLFVDNSFKDISNKIVKSKTEKRKIVGRAITSNLSTDREDRTRDTTPLDEEPAFTQVSYNDPEAAKDHRKLMEALGAKPQAASKQQRSEMTTTPAVENVRDRKSRLRRKN